MDAEQRIAELRKSTHWLVGIMVVILIGVFGALNSTISNRCKSAEQRVELLEKKVDTNANSYNNMRVEMRELRVIMRHMGETLSEIKEIMEKSTK